MTHRECKKCGENIVIPSDATGVRCESCGQAYQVDADAEFSDGTWKNLTSIKQITCDCALRSQHHEPMCPNAGPT